MVAADSEVDNWTMFHHDLTHSGYSTSAAPSTNQTLWSYATGSWVESSPAVVDGKVFIGSEDHNVYCLNAVTGAPIWNYTLKNVVYSSPAIADDKVYVGSWDNNVYCLNAGTGAFIWSYTTGYRVTSSPAVADGRVYIACEDNKIYAFGASPPIPEGLTIGVMLALSTIAVIVSARFFHKKPKL